MTHLPIRRANANLFVCRPLKSRRSKHRFVDEQLGRSKCDTDESRASSARLTAQPQLCTVFDATAESQPAARQCSVQPASKSKYVSRPVISGDYRFLISMLLFLDFQQNPFNANSGQRLSPQQQQMTQQQLIQQNFQQGANSNGNNAAQLSPRQPSFTQQSTSAAQANPANWNQQSATNIRLNLQQNNPMLNAQLSVSSARLRN